MKAARKAASFALMRARCYDLVYFCERPFMAARRSRFLPWLLAYKALRTPVAFGVSAMVPDAQGRLLLVRQRYTPGWHFPGGGVDRGEPPAKAIVRELREEVGLQSSAAPEFYGLYTRTVGMTTNVVALY